MASGGKPSKSKRRQTRAGLQALSEWDRAIETAKLYLMPSGLKSIYFKSFRAVFPSFSLPSNEVEAFAVYLLGFKRHGLIPPIKEMAEKWVEMVHPTDSKFANFIARATFVCESTKFDQKLPIVPVRTSVSIDYESYIDSMFALAGVPVPPDIIKSNTFKNRHTDFLLQVTLARLVTPSFNIRIWPSGSDQMWQAGNPRYDLDKATKIKLWGESSYEHEIWTYNREVQGRGPHREELMLVRGLSLATWLNVPLTSFLYLSPNPPGKDFKYSLDLSKHCVHTVGVSVNGTMVWHNQTLEQILDYLKLFEKAILWRSTTNSYWSPFDMIPNMQSVDQNKDASEQSWANEWMDENLDYIPISILHSKINRIGDHLTRYYKSDDSLNIRQKIENYLIACKRSKRQPMMMLALDAMIPGDK